ncbi:hypothetical protein AMTRI_Chr04g247540 [Amborella trichopoda]
MYIGCFNLFLLVKSTDDYPFKIVNRVCYFARSNHFIGICGTQCYMLLAVAGRKDVPSLPLQVEKIRHKMQQSFAEDFILWKLFKSHFLFLACACHVLIVLYGNGDIKESFFCKLQC